MKITKPEIVEKLFALQYEKWDAQNKIEQLNKGINEIIQNEINLINIEREKQQLLRVSYRGYTLSEDNNRIKSLIINDEYEDAEFVEVSNAKYR